MRYEIAKNKLGEKGLFSISDESGTLRFRLVSGRLCDPFRRKAGGHQPAHHPARYYSPGL